MLRRKRKTLTRREIIAKRQAEAEKSSKVDNFRRSRTLSQSRQSAAPAESERQAAWDLRLKRRKLTRWMIGVVLAAGLALLLLTQLVADVAVQAPRQERNNEYQRYIDILNEYYQARPIERLRFMINEPALHAFFLDKAPEVKSVNITGSHSLAGGVLQLTFRQPVAQWSSGGVTYFVDDSGVTFETNYFDKPNIVVSDKSGVQSEAGQEVINRRFLSFLGKVVALFRDNGLTAIEAVLPQDTVRQVEFKLEGHQYAIRMTVDRGAEAQVSQALRAMRHIKERGMNPHYIDVRVDQRVFYR